MAGTSTTLKLGYTNPLTDTFGAHPLLGAILDLNDSVTFTLASPDGLEIPTPPRTLLLAGNIRTQGEIATRSITRHNRTVTARLIVGPSSSSAALLASIRTLLLWLAAPPQIPITLQYQPFNASTPLYLDVVGAAHHLPADEGQWLRGQFEPLTITFSCRPGMRGDRVTLQNLLANPGFEQPSGGAGVVAFNDSYATSNAYATQAGAAPTIGAVNNTYPDVVSADTPLRYYRMSEASGTVAYDVSGSGQNGTYNAAPTLGVASPIFGDTADKAVTFNGTTQNVSVPVAGLPTGNANWSLECWFKIAANPAASSDLMAFGTSGTTRAQPGLQVTSAGGLLATTYAGDTAATAAVSLNVWHHAVATWDGTTLRVYLDGVAGPTATPGALVIGTHGAAVGSSEASTSWFPGSIDEAAFYNTTLSAARVLAHYNAGNAGTGMGTTASTMTLATGSRVSFGSPGWGPLNSWQTRFRFTSGMSAKWYLHYTDASNHLYCQYVSSTGQFALFQRIAGVANQLATTTIFLASNVWYWLRITQFIAAPNEIADLQASLLTDGPVAGTPGANLVTIGPAPTTDAITALTGRPQLEAVTATQPLILGGPYSSVHTVSLFGPGGWSNMVDNSGTGAASLAWEGAMQSATNTYPNGPVSSFGALRIDFAPAGTVTSGMSSWNGGGSPLGALGAMPVRSVGDTMQARVWSKSSGLGANGYAQISLIEYDTNGAFLRQTFGAQVAASLLNAGWQQLTVSAVTGVNTAYVALRLITADTSAAGASANATVWCDNAQVWNQTATGNSSMPWCDLRAAVSPATLVVSGLLGDLPAPAALALGTFVASLPTGGALSLYVGRKGITSPRAQLVGVSFAAFSPLYSPQGSAALDGSGYAGMYSVVSIGNGGGWNARFSNLLASDAAGVYHLLARVYSEQSPANLPNISLRVVTAQQTTPWFNIPASTDIVGQWYGPFTTPFVAQNTWTLADAGQCVLPPFPQGAMTDPSQLYLTPRTQWQDSSLANANSRTSWQVLLPVDGSLLVATVNNPANGAAAVANKWLWTYADGLLVNRSAAADGPAWLYSVESVPQPNPAAAAGGAGTQNSGAINVNSGADPLLTLDPAQAGGNNSVGVNQLVAVVSDQIGSVLPCFAEVSYSPLYLEPR